MLGVLAEWFHILVLPVLVIQGWQCLLPTDNWLGCRLGLEGFDHSNIMADSAPLETSIRTRLKYISDQARLLFKPNAVKSRYY